MTKKIIHLVLFLGVVSAISGLLLGWVNSFTAPLIAANNSATELKYIKQMYGDDATIEVLDAYNGDVIKGAYVVSNGGYAFRCEAKGFDGDGITAVIGFDDNGTVVGVSTIKMNETAGFGAENFTADFVKEHYIGNTIDQEVDMRAGSTLTSNAVKTMINACKDAYKSIKG